jgi:hypothetical protein
MDSPKQGDDLQRTPRRAQGTGVRGLILGGVIFILVVIAVAWWAGQYLPSQPHAPTIDRPTRSLSTPRIDVRLSMNQYNQIQTGMDYLEVMRILGRPGTELSRMDMAGYKTVMYGWANPDGSNLNVMLQNDRVISKAQFGLK